jgi:hypothetical protein
MLKIPVELRGRNAIHENFGGVISLIQTTSLGKKKIFGLDVPPYF